MAGKAGPRISSEIRSKIRAELKARIELEYECQVLALEFSELHDFCQDNKYSVLAREYEVTPDAIRKLANGTGKGAERREISAGKRQNIGVRLLQAKQARARMREIQAEYEELMKERRDYDVENIAERYGVSRTFTMTVQNARIQWNQWPDLEDE